MLISKFYIALDLSLKVYLIKYLTLGLKENYLRSLQMVKGFQKFNLYIVGLPADLKFNFMKVLNTLSNIMLYFVGMCGMFGIIYQITFFFFFSRLGLIKEVQTYVQFQGEDKVEIWSISKLSHMKIYDYFSFLFFFYKIKCLLEACLLVGFDFHN